MLHTSGPPHRARFKHRYTHKPFWRPAMTYRADDDPITWENRQFIEQVKRESYVNTRLTDDEGVANGNGGERYTQCSNVLVLQSYRHAPYTHLKSDQFPIMLQSVWGGPLACSGSR